MITVSWSVLNQYMICPLRVEKDELGEPHSISWAMAGGTVVHDTLWAWARGWGWRDVFALEWQKYENRTASQKNWNGEFTDASGVLEKAQALDLLKKYIGSQKDKPDPKLVELSLSKDLGDDIWLTGRIDALWHGKIIDWKLTSSPGYLSPIQAIIYAILNGGPSEFEYHALVKARNPYLDIIPIPETEKQENLDRIIDYHIKPIARMIQSGTFYNNPTSNLCSERYCGYWKGCKARLI